MKTNVEKLFFDWQDINTGECPKSYQIRVHAPGTSYDGDLMTHRLVKLLKEHGSKVINFPVTLLREIYEDCCWGFAGYLITSGALAYVREDSYVARPHNYGEIDADEWGKLANDITEVMRYRVVADISKYLELVTDMPLPDGFKERINSDEYVMKANEGYAATGDWILGLEDESLMPGVALALLGLRRAYWDAFWHNCDKFVPFEESA